MTSRFKLSERSKVSVTIVVPCFDEEPVLVHLHKVLSDVRVFLEEDYHVHVVLIDDGSTDGTWQLLQRLFERESGYRLVRHHKNMGVAGAILTGIRAAETEVVCSIDSDCSYDPRELKELVPMLTPGVDLVTGSPYHPLGKVEGVPAWRLALSRSASSLYRRVLRQKLYTYTSCFRVYRRSAIVNLELKQNGFLGIAELIGKLDLQGSRIVECPAKLRGRVSGVSKMKTTRVVTGHLYLLGQLLVHRGRRRFFRTADLPTTSEAVESN
jgi:glycosyltransferase involved in cell wall biosynthesis